jgi:hypothetical protein
LSIHAHFEQLCVLATSGQLSTAESDELNRHLLACDDCRTFFKDAHFITAKVVPQALRTPHETHVPAGMRERFLARAAGDGMKINAGAPAAAVLPQTEPAIPSRATPRFLSPHIWMGQLHPWQAWTTAALAGAACFALGALIRIPAAEAWLGKLEGAAASRTIQQPAVAPAPSNVDKDRIQALSVESSQLAQQVASLTSQLDSAKKDAVQAEAASQQKLLATQSKAAQDNDALTQQSRALDARVADLQSQLDTVHQQQLLADADLKAARAKTAEYSVRLEMLQTQMRNQESPALPSSSEISSLVAARNLHIIDVYDSNSSGKRQRAFGRAFLVEGKSLVFYAYDLNSAHSQRNITFHLWGEKAGIKETTLSMGVLHDDDPRERRWTLTCDDPNVLARINTVYVTAEPAGKQSDSPKGPKVLYAYFGAPPNHP